MRAKIFKFFAVEKSDEERPIISRFARHNGFYSLLEIVSRAFQARTEVLLERLCTGGPKLCGGYTKQSTIVFVIERNAVSCIVNVLIEKRGVN